jgi:Zn-dependent peptidase ImmA (M78 family)/DNA-binding Xre family transcriptional regulator
MFSADRLKMARYRRKLSGKGLAEAADITAVTVSKIENGHQPDDVTVDKLARALRYPVDFFFLDKPETLETKAVSFRSLKKMNASERKASLAAGSLGIAFYDWIDRRFNLPSPDLIDLSKERNRPEIAARLLRQHWGIGDRPIASLLKLYESKGIRILSLSENTPNVDAYSFWYGNFPYMFLNQNKTAERSNFDSAHELAHLVLHFHAGRESAQIEDAEKQADQFASAFLMPEADVYSAFGHVYSASQIIKAKVRWKVSAMALATRLHGLGMLTEWNYRSIIIDLGQRGYRRAEPLGIERETSTVLAKVLSTLWKSGITRAKIAEELRVPWEEIETLIFNLAAKKPARPEVSQLREVI